MRINSYLPYMAASMMAMAASISAAATTADEAEIVEGTLRIYGNDSYTIPYRKALSNGAPRARYPGFDNTTYLLKNGTIRRDGARALECDIILERDVAMTLRDGVTMYADVFRPANTATVPTILAWSPYGKEIGGQWLDDVASRSGVDLSAVSELQKFEGPDPAYWVAQGYAVVNPDSRGAYSSDGNITFWGRQLAEDGYDFIEWIAEQSWSTGKVAMSGNSWLAVSQWFIAAEQPPHLTAIAPCEGLTDLFRDSSNRGGIPQPGFQEGIITTFAGNNFIEDSPRMIINKQFMDEYWEDKVARLDEITAPAYIVASYTNTLHTHGSFQGFRNISSSQKWLRVHNSSEWPDYYATDHVQDLTKFFDYFLKGIDNGWEETAPVRLAVLDPAGHDILNRATTTWPPPGQVPNKFYLASNNSLSPTLETMEQSASYVVTGGADSIEFKWTVDELVETIGYMKVRVWVEAVGSDDMELSFTVAKRTANGTAYVTNALSSESSTLYESTGLLRVFQRHVDESKSGLYEPYLTHDREELLSSGEIVPVEVGLWPIALRLHPGEQLVLTISAASITPATVDLGFGTAIVPVPAAGGTFAQDANVTLINLGGDADSNPAYVNAQRVETPASRNNGTHVFHFGGSYDSHVLVPLGAVSSSRCSSQS